MTRTYPQYANPDDVADIAANHWDDDLIECRLDRHSYRQLNAAFNEREGTFTRVRRCVRCHVEEHLERSIRTGEKLRRRLDYSGAKEGYLLPKGTGRITTSAMNAVWLESFYREGLSRPGAAKVAANGGAKKKQTSKRAKPIRAKKAAAKQQSRKRVA